MNRYFLSHDVWHVLYLVLLYGDVPCKVMNVKELNIEPRVHNILCIILLIGCILCQEIYICVGPKLIRAFKS